MKINKYVVLVSRFLVGLTFIFSGFVKAVDPVGSQIKISEYLLVYGLEWLVPLALFGGIVLCCLEFIIGASLIFGVKARISTTAALLLMAFFTIQTLFSAITNPVTDCGCFGDAIKLTNWNTFYKNVVLIILALVVFLSRNKIKPLFSRFPEWNAVGIATLIIFFVAIGSYRFLPMIDFLPYKTGNDIKKLMTIPEGAARDVYKTVLIYRNKKTKETKQFSDSNIPTDDVWEWIETKNELIKEGYKPPIHDFTITNMDGEELTQKFLDEDGYRILIIQEQLKNSLPKGQEKLNMLVSDLFKDKEVKVWALTSSLEPEIKAYVKNNRVKYTFYNTDQTTLKTIIRSNPGILLLKNNLIIKKWPSRRIPEAREVYKYLYK
jgi:uncharacterized membrane protein YphA (DoxX/SURF4 family)